ncbi:MAG: Rrf2 family transcriptional regulator [Ruminococcus sp.]|nr:Rrf2 family transcriptional regulator [Ruminococcus sp.]
MKVSTRVEYGLIALADIAIYSEEGAVVPASDISERQSISQKYLEQILVSLKHAGLIKAHKGSGGGYTLTRSADKITMSEVLNTLDDSILADSFQRDSDSSIRDQVNLCFWNHVDANLREFAETVTLADFIAGCKNKENVWDMYVI